MKKFVGPLHTLQCRCEIWKIKCDRCRNEDKKKFYLFFTIKSYKPLAIHPSLSLSTDAHILIVWVCVFSLSNGDSNGGSTRTNGKNEMNISFWQLLAIIVPVLINLIIMNEELRILCCFCYFVFRFSLECRISLMRFLVYIYGFFFFHFVPISL